MMLWGLPTLGISCRNKKKAGGCEGETAGDVDHMVLMGQQRRERDEDKPGENRDTPETAQMSRINVRQQREQRCMQ